MLGLGFSNHLDQCLETLAGALVFGGAHVMAQRGKSLGRSVNRLIHLPALGFLDALQKEMLSISCVFIFAVVLIICANQLLIM